jgi:hypothetical protein
MRSFHSYKKLALRSAKRVSNIRPPAVSAWPLFYLFYELINHRLSRMLSRSLQTVTAFNRNDKRNTKFKQPVCRYIPAARFRRLTE